MAAHEARMKKLIEFTRTASLNEPYGCAIYDESDHILVSVTGNKHSPINHAEILAINECARLYPDVKWNTLTLYTTAEPGCMCASACCWANLKEVVYATSLPFMSKLWGRESPLRAIEIIRTHPSKPSLIGGICEEEANKLFLERRELYAQACQEKM
jgi:tRNA(Arg) A34 adenosine deaminase TadA